MESVQKVRMLDCSCYGWILDSTRYLHSDDKLIFSLDSFNSSFDSVIRKRFAHDYHWYFAAPAEYRINFIASPSLKNFNSPITRLRKLGNRYNHWAYNHLPKIGKWRFFYMISDFFYLFQAFFVVCFCTTPTYCVHFSYLVLALAVGNAFRSCL